MRIGYIRVTKSGLNQAEQETLLQSAGVNSDAMYVDGLPAPKNSQPNRVSSPGRAIAICKLRPGKRDTLVIATPAVLAQTLRDGLDVLRQIGASGAELYICSTATTYRWHPDALSGLELACSMEQSRVAEHLSFARKRSKHRVLGKWSELSAETKKRAKDMWPLMRHSAKEVSVATGVSVRTLYRQLGERSLPRHLGRRNKETGDDNG